MNKEQMDDLKGIPAAQLADGTLSLVVTKLIYLMYYMPKPDDPEVSAEEQRDIYKKFVRDVVETIGAYELIKQIRLVRSGPDHERLIEKTVPDLIPHKKKKIPLKDHMMFTNLLFGKKDNVSD